MKRCIDIQYNLPDYVRGNVTPGVTADVSAHLATCKPCTSEVAELRDMMVTMEQSKVAPPSPPYWGSILPRLHERLEGKDRQRIPDWVMRILVPASAALLLVVILLKGYDELEMSASSYFTSMMAQLPDSDLTRLADAQTLSIVTDATLSTSQESMSDKELLKSIITSDERDQLYAQLDPVTVLNTLSDEEADALVNILEQHSERN